MKTVAEAQKKQKEAEERVSIMKKELKNIQEKKRRDIILMVAYMLLLVLVIVMMNNAV